MKYHDRFLSLLNKQPKHLSLHQKALRIDKLACLEMDGEIAVNPQRSTFWFSLLCTVIDFIYYTHYSEIKDFPPFKKSILYACYLSDDDALDSLPFRKVSDIVRSYIEVRREVIEELTQYDGTATTSD